MGGGGLQPETGNWNYKDGVGVGVGVGGGLRLAFCRFSGIFETPALLFNSK
jgi:hypothetical protein